MRLTALHPDLQPFSPLLEGMVTESVKSIVQPFDFKHASKPLELPSSSHTFGRISAVMKTHTAYLTFAMCPSADMRNNSNLSPPVNSSNNASSTTPATTSAAVTEDV